MNRGEAAVFILRGNFGTGFVPGQPVHFFKDDWTKGTWAEPWAEAMYTNGPFGRLFHVPAEILSMGSDPERAGCHLCPALEVWKQLHAATRHGYAFCRYDRCELLCHAMG